MTGIAKNILSHFQTKKCKFITTKATNVENGEGAKAPTLAEV